MSYPRAMPPGVRVFLPREAGRKRDLEGKLLSVFSRWGFQEIVTPTFEYYEASGPGGSALSEEAFKIIDRETGHILALRSDITPQIARIASTLLATQPRPLRLCYCTSVFRHARAGGFVQREFHQGGVELIGLSSLEADAEVVAIAAESLREVGLEDFRLALGHTGFFRGILQELGVGGSERERIRAAVLKKDSSTLEKILKGVGVPPGSRVRLSELPDLFGGPEVLKRARSLISNRRSRRALADLEKIHRMLEIYGLSGYVTFDLSEIRGFDYYTGIIFEGFLEGFSYPVCGGGRYDELLSRYGDAAPATGFAVDIDRLLLALSRRGGPEEFSAVDFLIIDFSRGKRGALALARKLRARGFRVARDIIRRDLAGSLDYARSTGIRKCIVLGGKGIAPGRALVKDVVSGKEEARELVDLEKELEGER